MKYKIANKFAKIISSKNDPINFEEDTCVHPKGILNKQTKNEL